MNIFGKEAWNDIKILNKNALLKIHTESSDVEAPYAFYGVPAFSLTSYRIRKSIWGNAYSKKRKGNKEKHISSADMKSYLFFNFE